VTRTTAAAEVQLQGIGASPLRKEAFHESHALQCGFCTPGILMTMEAFLREEPDPTPERIRSALAGNLCRCNGYQNIITAVRLAADRSLQTESTARGTG
jgi:carbon-monoxide dehydrogenase small subunit